MGLFNINFTISREDAEIIAEVIKEKYSPTIRGIFYDETKKFFGNGDYVQLFELVKTIKFNVADNGGKVGKIALDVADEFGNSANREKFDSGIFKGIHENIDGLKTDIGNLNTKVENLGELENKISELQNLKTEIADSVKGEVTALENVPDDLKTLTEKVDALKNVPATLQTLTEKVTALENVPDDLKTLKNDNAILQSNLKQANDDIAKILKLFEENVNQQQEKIDKLTKQVTTITTEKTQLEGEKTEFEKKLQIEKDNSAEKSAKLEKVKADLERSEDNLHQAETTAATLQLKFEDAQREAQENSQALDAWREKTKIYAPVRDALKNCPTFTPIVEKYHLADDDSEVALFTFAQVLGVTESFSHEVYQTAVNHKKNNPQPMTQDEIAVYGALNKAYRTIWNIGFDIFVTPAGKSVTEPFVQENFDKKLAVNLKDPRNRDVSKINGIYVPMLRNKSGEYSQSAYVDAANR